MVSARFVRGKTGADDQIIAERTQSRTGEGPREGRWFPWTSESKASSGMDARSVPLGVLGLRDLAYETR